MSLNMYFYGTGLGTIIQLVFLHPFAYNLHICLMKDYMKETTSVGLLLSCDL